MDRQQYKTGDIFLYKSDCPTLRKKKKSALAFKQFTFELPRFTRVEGFLL